MGKLLEVENVHSYYGHIHALKGISLYVEEGEIVSLIGSNGAGKSTTLRTISGLLHPKQGTIKLEGKNIASMEPHLVVAAGVGHVPEGRGIFPKLTVRENLDMGAFTVADQQKNDARMEEVFELFPRLRERIDQLHGYMHLERHSARGGAGVEVCLPADGARAAVAVFDPAPPVHQG